MKNEIRVVHNFAGGNGMQLFFACGAVKFAVKSGANVRRLICIAGAMIRYKWHCRLLTIRLLAICDFQNVPRTEKIIFTQMSIFSKSFNDVMRCFMICGK